MSNPEDELIRYFNSLSDKITDAIRPVIREEAERVVGIMKSEAASYEGDLIESIRIEDGAHELELLILGGGTLTTNESGYDYALGIEFGNSKIAAQPFFYTVWRREREKVEERIRQAVEKAL